MAPSSPASQGLKDKEWFGKQDPYALITVRTRSSGERAHNELVGNPAHRATSCRAIRVPLRLTSQVGNQTFRTKTIHSGGTNPVFNETFKFNVSGGRITPSPTHVHRCL